MNISWEDVCSLSRRINESLTSQPTEPGHSEMAEAIEAELFEQEPQFSLEEGVKIEDVEWVSGPNVADGRYFLREDQVSQLELSASGVWLRTVKIEPGRWRLTTNSGYKGGRY